MGECRGRVYTNSEGKTSFDVYLPGQCSPESFEFPTLQEIIDGIQERQKITDTLAEAEKILQQHGKSSPLVRPERPSSRPRYTLIRNIDD